MDLDKDKLYPTMPIIDYPALIASLTTMVEMEQRLEILQRDAAAVRNDVSGAGYKLTIARLKAEAAEQTVTELRDEIEKMRAALPSPDDVPLAWSCQFLAGKHVECRRLEAELEVANRALDTATEENKSGGWKRAGTRKDSSAMILAKDVIASLRVSIADVKKTMEPVQRMVDDMIEYNKENAELVAWCEGTGPVPAEVREEEAMWWESVFEDSVALPLPRKQRLIVFV